MNTLYIIAIMMLLKPIFHSFYGEKMNTQEHETERESSTVCLKNVLFFLQMKVRVRVSSMTHTQNV